MLVAQRISGIGKPGGRCEASAEGEMTRQEWAMHWHCEEEVQHLEDMPWESEELKKHEVGLPRLKEERLQKVAKGYKGATGVGCDGFHPQVPLDLTKETRDKSYLP